MGYKYSCPTYNPTYTYPANLQTLEPKPQPIGPIVVPILGITL